MNFVVKQILVTGGAGFIGRNLVYRLVADGHTVTVIDSCETDNSKYGRSWLKDLGIDVLEASVHDNDCLANLVKSHEIIIHGVLLETPYLLPACR